MSDNEQVSVEAQKLQFEFFKHLTTIATASVLAVGAVAKTFKSPGSGWLLIMAVIILLVTVGLSIIGMLLKAFSPRNREDVANVGSWAIGSMISGLIFSVAFLLLNL